MKQPDHHLIDQCLKNQRKAQFVLYDWCFQELMQITTRYATNRDDASSLANQAFMNVLKSLDQYNRKLPFLPWLRTITIRVCIDEFRRNSSNPEWSVDPTDWPEYATELVLNEVVLHANVEQIEQAIANLPTAERMVFNLFELEGYTHKELATLLNVSERTSKRLLHQAKVTLQAKLAHYRPKKNAI